MPYQVTIKPRAIKTLEKIKGQRGMENKSV